MRLVGVVKESPAPVNFQFFYALRTDKGKTGYKINPKTLIFAPPWEFIIGNSLPLHPDGGDSIQDIQKKEEALCLSCSLEM